MPEVHIPFDFCALWRLVMTLPLPFQPYCTSAFRVGTSATLCLEDRGKHSENRFVYLMHYRHRT